MTSKILVGTAAAVMAGSMASVAMAQDFTLRMQTHYSPESVSGKLAQSFGDMEDDRAI